MRAIPRPSRVRLVAREDWQAQHAVALAADWLERHGVAVITSASAALRTSLPDLVVAIGGDGTLLRAARETDWLCPVVGVNLGTLGFLTAYHPDQLGEALSDIINGRLEWSPRLRAFAQLKQRSGSISEVACNDVVVKHGANPRLLTLGCSIDGVLVATIKGDGVIVSTPLGSTAYNLAAGGPILHPGAQALVLTPICPHSVTHRPVVAPSTSSITIDFLGPDTGGVATVDGQGLAELRAGDRLIIRASESPLKLVPPRASVFESLASRLGWDGGRRP